MDGKSPHQVFFLSRQPGAGKWCCHPSRMGEEGRHGLFILTLPFPEALGTPAEERPQSGPPPHGVYFLQIHYNASFFFPLECSFRNTFRCVASFYVTLADNLTSHQVSAGNTIHSHCAVPSCQVLSLLLSSHSERNELELRDAVVVSLKKES